MFVGAMSESIRLWLCYIMKLSDSRLVLLRLSCFRYMFNGGSWKRRIVDGYGCDAIACTFLEGLGTVGAFAASF